MSEGVAGEPVELVAARMRALGLDHEVFDPAATSADLAGRIEQSESLDALLSGRPPADPTAFDARWPAEAGAATAGGGPQGDGGAGTGDRA